MHVRARFSSQKRATVKIFDPHLLQGGLNTWVHPVLFPDVESLNALPAISLEKEFPELLVEKLVVDLEFLLAVKILVDVFSLKAFDCACTVEVGPISVDLAKLILVLDETWVLRFKMVISRSKPRVLFKLLIHDEFLILLQPSTAEYIS